MRSVGLDLGVRHIAYCEVKDGKVVDRGAVRSFSQLASRLGPKSAPAEVGFEACREGWHVHDTLKEWGHRPRMLDTTRIRQIGVGQHRRKNDAIDAEAIALAVESGRVAEAHVLSPERRALRAQLSVRGALVQTRSQYVTTIRGLARAAGLLLPGARPQASWTKWRAPRWTMSCALSLLRSCTRCKCSTREIVEVEAQLATMAEQDPAIALCATAPGVGLIVAATYVSVIDDAKRFRNAHTVAAYLGLVPGEATTGGPSKRRLGGITKQGNTYARALLVQSAWSILRARSSTDPLKRWGDHIAQTRGKKIAAVALARKLSGVLWAMLRDGTFYDGALEAQESARGVGEQAKRVARRAQALESAAKEASALRLTGGRQGRTSPGQNGTTCTEGKNRIIRSPCSVVRSAAKRVSKRAPNWKR